MAAKRKKQRRRELLRGGISLIVGLLLVVALAMLLPDGIGKAEPSLPANPFGEGDFQYDGLYLTCLTQESTVGIDVSAYQGRINWHGVAASGVEFAMIRVGYRGYENGLINEDEYAQINYLGAKAAGLRVGAYFFSQATTPEEALEEAEFLLEKTKDWQMDMPVVFDWEFVDDSARTAQMDREGVMACVRAFNDRIRQAGHQPMVYFNPYHAEHFLELETLAEYPFWLALYSENMDFAYQVDMWQYTSEGMVPGIEGPVDINLWFLDKKVE